MSGTSLCRGRCFGHGWTVPSVSLTRMTDAMADETQIPFSEQLEEIGAQLDWVRGYL